MPVVLRQLLSEISTHVKEIECSLKYDYAVGRYRLWELGSHRGRAHLELAHQHTWICIHHSCQPFVA